MNVQWFCLKKCINYLGIIYLKNDIKLQLLQKLYYKKISNLLQRKHTIKWFIFAAMLILLYVHIGNSFHYNTHCPSVWLWLICTVSIELITPGLRPMTSNSQYISEQCIAMLWGYPQLCGDNGPPGGHLRPERVMYATELILVINIHNMQRNCIVIAFCLLRESNMFDYFGEEDVGLNW